MARKRYATTPVHEVLGFHLDRTEKTQQQIADALGYDKANVISLMRTGRMKIPLAVAPRLAKEIGLNEWYFLEKCLAQYEPELLAAITHHFRLPITEHERGILVALRTETRHLDPPLKTTGQTEALVAFAKSLME